MLPSSAALYAWSHQIQRRPSGRLFRYAHILWVTAAIFAAVMDTSPVISALYGPQIHVALNLSLTFFALEYLFRLYVAPHRRFANPEGSLLRARWRWAKSLGGLVELMSVAPMSIALALGVDQQEADLFCIVWALKLCRYSPGVELLLRVLRNENEPLLSVLLVFGVIFLFAGVGMHWLEGDAQPEQFGSVPAALWWSVVTLTTTGYGDVTPQTVAGRALAGLVMLGGIAVFALWAGILAEGFSKEIRRRDFLRTWDLVAKVPFFHRVGAGVIADVAKLLKPKDVPAGVMVMQKGEAGDCMYFVVSGEVEVLVEPKRLVLGPSSFFGEIALITGGPRTATIVAKTAVTLLMLDIADFRQLAARRPELTEAVYAEAARRLHVDTGAISKEKAKADEADIAGGDLLK